MKVEIPKGSSNKYEYNLITKELELDRVLAGAMFYPEEYGFIPRTLDYDGDPLDVICLTNQPTFPGCQVPVRVIGILKMIDGGEEDDKLLVVNAVDPRLKKINSLREVSKEKLAEISNFFLHYKELENKKVIIGKWKDKREAQKIWVRCQKLYSKFIPEIDKGISKEELVKKLNKQKKLNNNMKDPLSLDNENWMKEWWMITNSEEMREKQDKILDKVKIV